MLLHAQARKRRPGKKRRKDEDELSDEELAEKLGGWLEVSLTNFDNAQKFMS